MQCWIACPAGCRTPVAIAVCLMLFFLTCWLRYLVLQVRSRPRLRCCQIAWHSCGRPDKWVHIDMFAAMFAVLCAAGEEQAKVEVLSDRLAQLGEDVDALLATVAANEEDGAGEEGAEELL